MLYYSNAKINLGLNIVNKRADGFHDIETVFYPISINDALEFIESDVVSLSSSGLEVDCPLEQNLIIKAYSLLQKDFKLPTLKFHLHKVIPFGAGMGGGSANAAYTLVELNRFFKLNLSEDQLMEYARQLGADCAFFIKNSAVYAEQKGDVFTNLNLDLSDYYILLIHPGFGVSTQEAYANVSPKSPAKNIQEIIKQDISTWETDLENEFEQEIFKKYPVLDQIKTQMYSNGALYAAMSGSGSTVFGIFKNEPNIEGLDNYWFWKGKLK